jgi:S1-C subfamily serine protease
VTRWTTTLAALALLASAAAPVGPGAAPRAPDLRPDPRQLPALPSFVQRVQAAVVGLRIRVPPDRPSAESLGSERAGSGVIFDPRGYVLTVSYLLLDAERIEATLRGGRTAPARLIGLDLENGLGVVQLAGPGPWPVAALGDSTRVVPGDMTGTVGVDEDGDLVATQGSIEEIRPYVAAWEWQLDRAFIVAPHNPAFGGSALVDSAGQIIGITSLRLGPPPHVSLAIPAEKFVAGRDELLSRGRVESRRPRPWLGLLTESHGGGVLVVGLSPAGPAGAAGVRRGDLIVRLNGEAVSSREDFYRRLWEGQVGEELVLVVQRAERFQTITVRSADRYRVFRTIGN